MAIPDRQHAHDLARMPKKNQYSSKHVRLDAEHGLPEPEGEQFIVRLVRSRGGNVMECESSAGGNILCLLPAKFSRVVWAQRGDFLIVEPLTSENSQGPGKISANIVHILFPEQVDHLRKIESWPEYFKTVEEPERQARKPAPDVGTVGSREDGLLTKLTRSKHGQINSSRA